MRVVPVRFKPSALAVRPLDSTCGKPVHNTNNKWDSKCKTQMRSGGARRHTAASISLMQRVRLWLKGTDLRHGHVSADNLTRA